MMIATTTPTIYSLSVAGFRQSVSATGRYYASQKST
jgi:hypothetical protein